MQASRRSRWHATLRLPYGRWRVPHFVYSAPSHPTTHFTMHFITARTCCCRRLDTIPFPPKDMLGPGSSVGELDDTALVEQYIRRDAKTQGVGWNSTMHSQIFKAVEKLHALHRVLHHPKAVRALHDARVWLEGDLFPDRKAQTPSRLPKSPSMFPISNEDKKSGGNSPSSHLERSNSLGLIDREDFTPAIEELVAASEWSVRVPSLPPAHRKSHISVAIEEDTTTRTTKLLSEAAVSFEKHLRAHVGKALRDDAEFGEVTGKASGRMVSAGEKDASERTVCGSTHVAACAAHARHALHIAPILNCAIVFTTAARTAGDSQNPPRVSCRPSHECPQAKVS